MKYKLGSLFDGSGGFPLAGVLCGVEPVWAAEIEPYPIAVTRSRFPHMKHLGDISKINGAEIEPVDIITFGSPCQDLSVAGKRAGLKHEANGDEETTRSGLFMEAVRIIKEMRRATNGKYPRTAIWENVPGAFSSNNGEDFRIVCEELIKIVEPSASMPSVPKGGWNYADSLVGDGWSLAYRVFDAQYWGVPQRRRRIYLVADFGGQRAREILFEREGLRGYFAEGGTPWQTTPADAEGSLGADDRERECFDGYNGDLTGDKSATLGVNCGLSTGRNGVIERGRQLDAVDPGIIDSHILDDQGGSVMRVRTDGKAPTLRAQMGGHPPVVMTPTAYSFDSLASNSMKSKNPYSGCREVAVAKTLDTTDPNPCKNQGGIAVVEPVFHASKASFFTRVTEGAADTLVASDYKDPQVVAYSVENHPADSRVGLDESGKVQTLTGRMGTGGGNVPMIMEPFVKSARGKFKGDAETWKDGKVANTLNTFDQGETRANELVVAYGLDRASYNQGQNAKFNFSVSKEQQPTLTARGPGAVCCTTGSFTQITEEVSPTLMARDWKDPTCVCSNYIVRRLTPTECARLQGFADWWGSVEKKKSLTDEEYHFWLDVRNTHARINGKKEQEYQKKQMLTWYNKLWTDSAEYKMWGNGIALPTVLYCVQGVVEALQAEEDDAWML